MGFNRLFWQDCIAAAAAVAAAAAAAATTVTVLNTGPARESQWPKALN